MSLNQHTLKPSQPKKNRKRRGRGDSSGNGSYSGKGMQDQQGQLMFAREISSLAKDKDFSRVLLIDDLSDTGLTLNKSIEWLRNYAPTKNFIQEVKTACLWKKKSSTFEPDFCPIKLDSDPWIVQPTEHYEELSIEEIVKKNKQG